jgi:hypothetical protein|tara:strand:- start:119 stop:388 length:270 start_codon:yes stop_codon:yes gene_type:complete
MQDELHQLIKSCKGKFFSLTFIKADGSERVVNGKDKYTRLLAGGVSTVSDRGYVSIVDRNKGENGAWIAAHNAKAVRFKCGAINKTFVV